MRRHFLAGAGLTACGMAIICVALPGTAAARAECPPQWLTGPEFGMPGVNSYVFATAEYDDGGGPALYAGGLFTTAGGVPASKIARWDGTSWAPLGSGLTGTSTPEVRALTVYNGELIAGGSFNTAGGVPVNNIASWNGTDWTPLGSGINGQVYALAVFNGRLIAGASSSVGGLLAWDGTNWTTAVGLSGSVQALTVYNGALILGGTFGLHIARWTGGTSVYPLGSGTNGTVTTLESCGGILYAGGPFSTAGGVSASFIAQWNGTAWASVGGGVWNDFGATYARVYALKAFGGELYAGGYFDLAGGVPVRCIARWNGTSWSAVGGGIVGDPAVYALGTYGEELIAAGGFYCAGDVVAAAVASWNGVRWAALGSGAMPGAVYALHVADGQLLAGGGFGVIAWDGASYQHLGSALCSWYFDGGVCALLKSGDTLLAGGHFDWFEGLLIHQIAQWDGAAWAGVGAGLGSTSAGDGVYALTEFGGQIVAGGIYWGDGYNGISSWNGAEWAPLGGGVDGDYPRVLALTVFSGELIAGGGFWTAGGVEAQRIAKWDGNAWTPLGSGMNDTVWALAIYDGGLIAAGEFTLADGISANHIASWNGATWAPLGEGTNDDIYLLTVFDGRLIAGGRFTAAGGTDSNHIAAWDGTSWTPLGAGLNSYAYTGVVYDGRLVIGGYFTAAGGQPSAYWARWGCPYGKGDLNCDGAINGYDIDPFVLALTDPGAYDALQPDCDYLLADINRDEAVDGYDIDPFVSLLTRG